MISDLLAGIVKSVCTHYYYHHHHHHHHRRRRYYCSFEALIYGEVLIPWQLHVASYTETEPLTVHDVYMQRLTFERLLPLACTYS